MAIAEQKFREIVFQLLFSQDFSEQEEGVLDFMMEQLSVTRKVMREAEAKRKEIFMHIASIDEVIRRFSSSYDLQRIAKVEKNVLRLGVYELLYEKDLPPKVAIAEAIRLTRKFSTAASASFVNAVLDALFQSGEKDVLMASLSAQ